MGVIVKYLLVLLVVAIGVWSLVSRLRGPRRDDDRGAARRSAGAKPLEMVRCAHCGLHLAASEAVDDGPRHYCSESHRRLGPVEPPPA